MLPKEGAVATFEIRDGYLCVTVTEGQISDGECDCGNRHVLLMPCGSTEMLQLAGALESFAYQEPGEVVH